MTLNMYDELMNLRITAHRSGYKDRCVSFAPRNSAVTYNAGRFAIVANDHSLGRELNTMRADSR